MPLSRKRKVKCKKGSPPPKTRLIAKVPSIDLSDYPLTCDEPAKKLIVYLDNEIINKMLPK